MWKKTENDQPEVPPTVSSSRSEPVREQAVIGASLVVKGDVSGDEDLVIQGQVEGKVLLKNHGITVGRNGQVRADLFGKTIAVDGTVQGNLYAEEKIVVRQSGNVRGNLQAPRICLEDGARFKGSIDMDAGAGEKGKSATQASSGPQIPQSGEKADRVGGQAELGIKLNQASPGK
jgi:cytoskeletal protein CcmA (bactofilin family)